MQATTSTRKLQSFNLKWPRSFRASLMTRGFSGRLPELDAEGDERAYSIARYDRSIAYLDAQVGGFFDLLRDRGLFDNSLIVVTADHGENFDEDRPAADDLSILRLHCAPIGMAVALTAQHGSTPCPCCFR